MPIKDSLIAATALVHGLTVVTRKSRRLREGHRHR
jgi:predicted nucleic acid-binding protein